MLLIALVLSLLNVLFVMPQDEYAPLDISLFGYAFGATKYSNAKSSKQCERKLKVSNLQHDFSYDDYLVQPYNK